MTDEDVLNAFRRGSLSIKVNNASAGELKKLQNILGMKLNGEVDLFNFYMEKDKDYYICNTASLGVLGNWKINTLLVAFQPLGINVFTMERFFSFFDDKKIQEDDFLEVFQ